MNAFLSAAIVTLSTVAALASAETDIEGPLASIEARVGYGAALGGHAENAVARATPVSLQLRGSWLVREQPRISTYVGLAAELGDRTSAGLGAGFSVPIGSFGRASAGGVAILVPYRLVGPSASIGSCVDLKGARPCLDLEATFYGFGSDVPSGSVVTQLQAVLAFGFDVL